MSDLELLFIVIAFVYAFECVCWIPRGSVVFRTWFGKRWRPVHPSAILGNQHGGFVFAPPLPPLGTFLVASQIPLSISPEAVLAFVSPSINPGSRPPQTGRLLRWEEIRSAEAKGKKLVVNGDLLVKTASSIFASDLAGLLRAMAKPSVAQDRRHALENLPALEAKSLKSLKQRWEEFEKRTVTLGLISNLLFVFLFVLAPIVTWRLGLSLSWPLLLLVLLGLTCTAATLFWRTHKFFYPSAADERFTQTLIVLLSPATAIRARDILSRPLLDGSHPLLLARMFCSEVEFRSFAQTVFRELKYPALPLCPRVEPLAQATQSYSHAVLLESVEKFLEQNGINSADVLRAPAPLDSSCLAYCPRCLTQFTGEAGECRDCGNRPLVRLSSG